jgi:hypothetical protein
MSSTDTQDIFPLQHPEFYRSTCSRLHGMMLEGVRANGITMNTALNSLQRRGGFLISPVAVAFCVCYGTLWENFTRKNPWKTPLDIVKSIRHSNLMEENLGKS